MIVPMEQLILLCATADRASALEALRALGCVHVRLELRDSEPIRRAAMTVASVEQSLRILSIAETNGLFAFKPETDSPVATMTVPELLAAAEALQSLDSVIDVTRAAELITRLREEHFTLRQTLHRYQPFGSLTPATIQMLKAKGLPVTLFKLSEKSAAALDAATPEAVLCVHFGVEAAFLYGAWVGVAPLPEGCEVLPLPALSTAEMTADAERTESVAHALLHRLANAVETLRPQFVRLLAQKSESKAFAEVSENLRTEGSVAYLLGYVPQRAQAELLAKASANGWGLALNPPEPDDPHVPVMLEPPRGFRAITTLFKGLGILPGYAESDISVPFYVFFSLFFAMLIGDAGYGALMLLGVGAAAWKLHAKKAARPVLLIFSVFCLATILWGVLSGTYFGINHQQLPAGLTALPTVDWLGNQDNIMFLCFAIGAVHLCLARLWNAICLAPNTKALAELGWMGVTISMFLIVAGIVVSWFTQPTWTWWLLGGSVALIALFMLKPCELKTQGVSLGMLPLNVISSMGDVISYVRLFAVGLASVKVAENFNTMAFQLEMPMVFRILCICLILLLGHGLNLAMGALSILVHAVRLNTLEFSGAKGITWCGVPYVPFRLTSQQ
ncbi:MAG: hypothetical protein RR133_01095 [Kiritimatiellia bacterium]